MKQDSVQKPVKARSKNHEIIGRFLKVENSKTDKYFWPREMKLAGFLLKKYTYEFLIQAKEPFYPLKMNSFAWFKTDEGEEFLSKELFEYKRANVPLSKEKEEIVLSPTKIGEDIQLLKKPKTLKDFLNYGKTNNETQGGNPTAGHVEKPA